LRDPGGIRTGLRGRRLGRQALRLARRIFRRRRPRSRAGGAVLAAARSGARRPRKDICCRRRGTNTRGKHELRRRQSDLAHLRPIAALPCLRAHGTRFGCRPSSSARAA
jgi:hypothetical protein